MIARRLLNVLLALGVTAIAGCDWSSQGTSLNTSQGAGVNINFSGVYNGTFGGGLAVRRTSKGNITRLVINQAGNRVEVVDNQGSRYEGTVGSPGAIANADATGAFPAGAEIVQSQISFAGKDEVAQKDIEFVGIIHVVTVTDIKGTTDTKTDTDTDNTTTTDTENDTYTYNQTVTITSNVIDGQVITVTDRAYDPGGNLVYEAITETTIEPSGDTTTITRVITDTRNETSTETDNSTRTVTSTTTYNITEANSQYRLEGTWIEKDSPIVSDVDALSPGGAGSVTTTTTDTTATDAGA